MSVIKPIEMESDDQSKYRLSPLCALCERNRFCITRARNNAINVSTLNINDEKPPIHCKEMTNVGRWRTGVLTGYGYIANLVEHSRV